MISLTSTLTLANRFVFQNQLNEIYCLMYENEFGMEYGFCVTLSPAEIIFVCCSEMNLENKIIPKNYLPPRKYCHKSCIV